MTQDNAPKTVTKRLRFEIFRRDGFRCFYCGLPALETGEGLTIDHVIPKALGGTNDSSNLVTACKDCNSGKTSSGPDETTVAQVADDAVRWAAAVRQAHLDAQAELHVNEAEVRAFGRYWKEQAPDALPGGWKDSVREFVARGMTRADLFLYIDKAANTRSLYGGDEARFKYFCGCCWNVISDRERKAMSVVAPEPEPVASPAQSPDGRVMIDGAEHYPLYSVGDDLRTLGVARIVATGIAAELELLVGDGATLVDGWHDWPSGHNAYDEDGLEGYLASVAGAHFDWVGVVA